MAMKTIAKYECAGYNNSICDKVKKTDGKKENICRISGFRI